MTRFGFMAVLLTVGCPLLSGSASAESVNLSEHLSLSYTKSAGTDLAAGEGKVTLSLVLRKGDQLIPFHSLNDAVAAYEKSPEEFDSICGSIVMKGAEVSNGEERVFQINDSRVARKFEAAGLKSSSQCPERPGFLGVSCIASDCDWNSQGATSGQCGPGLAIDPDGFWPLEVICMCTPGLPKLPKFNVPKSDS